MANMADLKKRAVKKISFVFGKKYRIVIFYNLFKRPISRIFFKKNILKSAPAKNFTIFNSSKPREVEILEEDKKLEQAIISCYFINKVDPQWGIKRSMPDFNYIKPWYESVIKQKLNGIIIHDGIAKEFIEQYQNPYISFREFTPGDYSIFEERWFAYYLFLSGTKIKKVFFTDISDVIVTEDPYKTFNDSFVLYVGRDHANKVGVSQWVLSELNNYIKDANYKVPGSFYFQQVYNIGVTGGSRQLMMFFISRMIDLILLTTTSYHKDITLANLVIHKYFFPKIIIRPFEPAMTRIENDDFISHNHLMSGFPLNSVFGKFEFDSKAVFIHK
jgi:hypothetical protein